VKIRIFNSERIFSEFFKIDRTRVQWERFDGSWSRELTRYVIRRGDSVGIIPVCRESNKEEKIILIKQFRLPAVRDENDGFIWEIPAGMIDRGEEPIATAKRELLEEIRVPALDIEPLISFFLSPGAMDEKMYLFKAEVGSCMCLKKIGGNEREDESTLIKMFTQEEILHMIKENEIFDAKTIAGILYYFALK